MAIVLTDKQRFWHEHIQAAKKKNIPLSHYAQHHNLDSKALYRWKSALEKRFVVEKTDPTPFVKVKPESEKHRTEKLTVVLPNGIRIEAPADSELLVELLRKLVTI